MAFENSPFRYGAQQPTGYAGTQVEVDQGLRTFMLGVYNNMMIGLVLTGLTRTAAGPVATIDNRDYAVGDRLGALTITAIDAAEVTLASGTHRLRLRLGRPDQARPG